MEGVIPNPNPNEENAQLEMVQLLREFLLPSLHIHISKTPNRSRSGRSIPTSRDSNHVTLEGFDESDATAFTRQSRRRSRSRSFIKDHRAGAGIINVMICADECVYQLQQVANRLSTIASRNEQLAKGQKVSDPGQDYGQLAELAQRIMTISREAFVPAHRLCQSCIGLYLTEDFIRESRNIQDCLEHFSEGRVRVPDKDSQIKTIEKLQACVDKAEQNCIKFRPLPVSSFDRQNIIINPKINQKVEYEEMRDVLLIMQSSLKNLYSTANGCFHLFGLLLYINPEEQETLAEFLNSLNSMEKSDLLEDISTLRRSVDHIPLLLEKLSWASYAVFRLASGKSVSPSPVDSGMHTPNDETISQTKSQLNSMLAQREIGTEDMYSRVPTSSRSRSKEKYVVQQASISDRDFHGRHGSRSRSQSRSNKSSKSGATTTSSSQPKSKPRSRERLSDQQQRGRSSKMKDKKTAKKSRSQSSRKSRNIKEAGSLEDVDYYE